MSIGRLTPAIGLVFFAAGCAHGPAVSAAPAAQQEDGRRHDHGDAHGDHDAARHGPHLVSRTSSRDFATTLAALQSAIEARGFRTFTVIDHAAGAASVGAALRPTTLIVFGNPKGGAPLMHAAQTLGLVLPLRALVYQAEDGAVVVAMQDVVHDVHEHAADGQAERAAKIAETLAAIAAEATTRE